MLPVVKGRAARWNSSEVIGSLIRAASLRTGCISLRVCSFRPLRRALVGARTSHVRAARQASLRRQDGSGSCQSTFRYVRLGCARFDRASVCGLFAWLLVRTLRTAQLVADRRTTCPQLVGRQSLCRYRPAVTAPSAAPKSAGQPINAPSVDGRCAATPWPDSSDEGTSLCADAHGAERGDVAAARSAILPCLVRRAARKSAGQPAERSDLARLRGSQDLADRLGMPASRTLRPQALSVEGRGDLTQA